MTSAYRVEDFPKAGLDQATLDAVVGHLHGVEALYPPSALQEGVLFHSLYAASSAAYVTQVVVHLGGPLDESAFVAAWSLASRRHSILRCSLPWKGLRRPLICVHGKLALPLHRQDWTDIEGSHPVEARLEAFLEDDRRRGFSFHEAPLMRLGLIRLRGGRYVMVWSYHPLLLDAGSTCRVLTEVLEVYEAVRMGRPVQLEPVRQWEYQVEWLEQRASEGDESFWRRYLAGCEPPARPAVDRYESSPRRPNAPAAVAHRALGRPLWTKIGALAETHRIERETVIEAAVALALARLAGTSDVLFGVSRPPWHPAKPDDPVGLLLSTVPARIRVALDRPFGPWLRVLQRDAEDRTRHDQAQLVQIHGWADLPRNVPLFDTHLVFEPEPLEHLISRTWTALWPESIEVREEPHYPLTIACESGPEARLRVAWDRSRWSATMAKRILGYLHRTLEDMTSDRATVLGDIGGLDAYEAKTAIEAASGPAPLSVQQRTVHEIVEAVARRTPQAAAVVLDNAVMPYGDLNRRANMLARWLQSHGVGPEVPVAVSVEASPALAVALLAVAKSGGAYVPIDPASPTERVAKILHDCGAPVIITHGAVEGRLPALSSFVVRLDHDWPRIATMGDADGVAQVDPDSLAYIVYTSGTTGEPTGVECTHRALLASTLARASSYPEPVSALLLTMSVAFDAGGGALWWTLTSGGRLTLPNPSIGVDLIGYADLVRRQGVSHLMMVPSMYRSLLQAANPQWLRSVRSISLGGEVLSADLVQKHFESLPKTRLINEYGPTEACVWTTAHVCHASEERIPIGSPVAGMRAYVLDEAQRPVPDGVVGELYVSGPQVARGYRNRPEKTAQTFMADPWQAGIRMVRTGDFVARLPNGEIVFVGRRDRQVKIRGHRVELEEIEALLTALPTIHECAVLVDGHDPEARLVAYVVPSLGSRADEQAIRRALEARLPAAMIPSVFVPLERLPRGPGGKLDRSELPSPQRNAVPVSALGARTPLEAQLVRIWCELLSRGNVGVDEDFFDLGGHSLLATRVIARLREAPFGVELPLSALFEAPTVAGLAARIERAREAGNVVVQRRDSQVIAAMVNELGDEDVDRMLQELLEEREGTGES